MPIVDIKGVGKAQFPDDMGVDDIRSFLRNKYYNDAISDTYSLPSNENTAQPYNPSLAERMGQGISDTLYDTGLISNRYGAQETGRNISALGEFLPVIGDATAGDEFGRAAAQGDNTGMLLAGIGAVPVAGDIAKKTLRRSKSITLPSGRLGADQYKLIKQSDPQAKTKANPDGSVSVDYLDEYQPTQIKGPLYEFDPDGLEISEGTFKNTSNYKGDKNKPISVTKENGNYIVLDGHHRAKIAKEEGRNVRAVVIPIDDVKRMQKDNVHQGDMLKEWVADGSYEKQKPTSLPMDDIKLLPYGERVKAAREWETGRPIKVSYARNKESSKNYPAGMDFGQKLEPAGKYMNIDFGDGGFNKNIPNWEFGEIEFKNPIVLEHKSTNSTGWKKDLSEMFGGLTGKRLSNKIKKAGYDGIITKDTDGFNETISLK